MAAGTAAMVLLRTRALQSYLHLRRASVDLFANDERTLLAARERTRTEYLKHRNVEDPTMVRFPKRSISSY